MSKCKACGQNCREISVPSIVNNGQSGGAGIGVGIGGELFIGVFSKATELASQMKLKDAPSSAGSAFIVMIFGLASIMMGILGAGTIFVEPMMGIVIVMASGASLVSSIIAMYFINHQLTDEAIRDVKREEVWERLVYCETRNIVFHPLYKYRATPQMTNKLVDKIAGYTLDKRKPRGKIKSLQQISRGKRANT